MNNYLIKVDIQRKINKDLFFLLTCFSNEKDLSLVILINEFFFFRLL